MHKQSRGCVFFNFGSTYALRLIVAIFSLRRFYHGSISVFLVPDKDSEALAKQLEKLDCGIIWIDQASKSCERHTLFRLSPYKTTLIFDSDLLFRSSIDALWEPLEQKGLLVTRFFPSPYGVDGTPQRSGWSNRIKLLSGVRPLVDEETYQSAFQRLTKERIDVNVGVMGIDSSLGDDFLQDWSNRMECGRQSNPLLLDEMLVVAILSNHRHILANEVWNCPADEFFRRTNLGDARIIHYFADGHKVNGIRLGRNPNTWAGQKWFSVYQQANKQLDLEYWKIRDTTF